jgi:hypothetical protein
LKELTRISHLQEVFRSIERGRNIMEPVREVDKRFHDRSAEHDHHQAEVSENQYSLEGSFLHLPFSSI